MISEKQLLEAIVKHKNEDKLFKLEDAAFELNIAVSSEEFSKALRKLEVLGFVRWYTPTVWEILDV